MTRRREIERDKKRASCFQANVSKSVMLLESLDAGFLFFLFFFLALATSIAHGVFGLFGEPKIHNSNNVFNILHAGSDSVLLTGPTRAQAKLRPH